MGVAQFYCTQHSWTLDEYLKAFLKDEQETKLFTEKRNLFEVEWEILDDTESQGNKRRRDGSKKQSTIREAVTQKFAHAGGSARWMMNYSVAQINSQMDTYLTECSNLSDLLSFTLGPESPMAKTHLYFSAPGENDTTLYSMVSARATLLAVERHGTNGIKELYKHAAKLNNPAFLGWIIEADLFNRCSNHSLTMKRKGQQDAEAFDSGPPVEFNYNDLLVACEESEEKGKEKDALNAIGKEAARFVPTTKGKMQTCKPSAWNQGGYDVVFIKASDENEKSLVVRFGQVTKSYSHSLKLKFYHNFLKVLVKAGYQIDSVEVAFIVLSKQVDNFHITSSKVDGSGLLSMYTRYGTPPTEDPKKETGKLLHAKQGT